MNRSGDAPPLLLKAAKRLEPLDQRLARETYLEALTAVFFPAASWRATRSCWRPRGPPGQRLHRRSLARASDLLLDGLALLITDGYAAGTPTLRRAVNAFRGEDISRGEGRRWLWLASRVAAFLWDDETWDVLSARFVQLARDAGALSVLPLALTTRTGMHSVRGGVRHGRFAGRRGGGGQRGDGCQPRAVRRAGTLAAFQGREAEAAQLIETATKRGRASGRGTGADIHSLGDRCALQRPGPLRGGARRGAAGRRGPARGPARNWGLVELIEAAARSGKPELAADALDRLSQTTAASGTDWALGVEARSRALLTEGKRPSRSIARRSSALERTRVRVELARAHLLYGEWLRRERRRLDAREQLRHAHELFTEFGMEAFAERARVELEATGEHARKRTVETRDDLTPQEAQISRLAADGATNQEIAAQLFISPSTVDYHLRKAFRKLGVKSRHQLKQHLLQPGAHADTAARGN